jgi:hypothetical protein
MEQSRSLVTTRQARRRRHTIDAIVLPRCFVDSPLFREWSGDSQKLYFWLRARIGRADPLAPETYRQLLADNYLATFASAELLMEQAVDCSRNTLTKLIRELAERRVAQVPATRPGYVFILGERQPRQTRWLSESITCDVYYLDQLVASSGTSEPTDRQGLAVRGQESTEEGHGDHVPGPPTPAP